MDRKEKEPVIKSIAKNRKAHQRFAIIEALEAGLALKGHEVKSLRQSKVSIEEGLVRVNGGEIFLFNVYIAPYSHYSYKDIEPTRTRKLLMHRSEITRLSMEAQRQGMTLIPLEIYFKNGRAKVTVGLAKGKKDQDRREDIKKRDTEREIRRKYVAR